MRFKKVLIEIFVIILLVFVGSIMPLSAQVTDIDGNVYNTVTIGTQVWMVENLRTTRYRNGDPIPYISDNAVWDITTGAYFNYDNNPSNSSTYGRLYNWYAVSDNRNIAPTGWHVPTFAEWTTLIAYLGGQTVAGGKLKEVGTSHWLNPNTGATNETGFTALPSGRRNSGSLPYYPNASFTYLGESVTWFTPVEYDAVSATVFTLYNYLNSFTSGGQARKKSAYSVRCVKDIDVSVNEHWDTQFISSNAPNSSIWTIALNGTDVYIGGNFSQIGGYTSNRVAKWNSGSWYSLGNGFSGGDVSILKNYNGSMYAGGTFITADGSSSNSVAIWNGSIWLSCGTAGQIAQTDALSFFNGNLFSNYSRSIVKLIGNTWQDLGLWSDNPSVMDATSNYLYAGGWFTQAGGALGADYVAKYNGSSWSSVGSSGLNGGVTAMCISGAVLYIGGSFTTAGGQTVNHIAKWDGSSWSPLGSGTDGFIRSIAVSGTDVYVGGQFTTAGGIPANNIAKWNGTNWSALGSGVDAIVYAIAISGDDVYVGGSFGTAGGKPSNYFARWNSTVNFDVPTIYLNQTSVMSLVNLRKYSYIVIKKGKIR